MKPKHFKIAEQIIIISLIGVLLPSVIALLIINNVSRHSIRRQLSASVQAAAKTAEFNMNSILKSAEKNKTINPDIFKDTAEIKYIRIYITDLDGKLEAAHNYEDDDFKTCIAQLPNNPVDNTVSHFEKIKNRPRVYLRLKDLNKIIIAAASKELTNTTINEAQFKIIAAFIAAAAVTLFLTLMYCSYLYFNIRQLFRGIIAVSRGNYIRPVSLKTSVMTPREIIFLAEHFNNMINRINKSHSELEQKNKELERLDNFRSNLIDTVSHELRTPLTSIKGYTSRLLRTDIKIDESIKHKSLLIIKQQSERLSRMIEDLLSVPDIEGAKLNINLEPVNLLECIETAVYSVKGAEEREIENNVTNNFPLITADKDRLEQVLINLISNAHKYAYKDSPVKIDAEILNNQAVITISNKADYIKEDLLNTLFDKFIRLDNKNQVSKGTGLGLYIAKGLIDAMQGKIKLSSSCDNIFTVSIILDINKN